MKKLIAIVSLMAFAVAVQAGGEGCCSKTKTSTAASQDNHACCSKTMTSTASTKEGQGCCSKTMTSAQTKATCSAGQTSCCASHVMAKKILVSHTLLSPKAAAAL